jgi:hypothetical protein
MLFANTNIPMQEGVVSIAVQDLLRPPPIDVFFFLMFSNKLLKKNNNSTYAGECPTYRNAAVIESWIWVELAKPSFR